MLLGSLAFSGLVFLGGSSASADSYTIQSGDTLKSIAQSHATTVDKLVSDNSIQNANLIYSGETIEIINGELPVTSTQQTQVVQAQPSIQQPAAETQQVQVSNKTVQKSSNASNSGSVHDQFIAAGGSESLWTTIVLPESGGNPNAVSPNGYTGLGQTKESWGTGSVAEQTKGLVNYANSRYGSVENAVSFRASNNWW